MEEDICTYVSVNCFSLKEKLKPDHFISCIGGSPSQLFVGTSAGEIHHVVCKDGKFREVGVISLPEEKEISQIEYASALNILFVLCNGSYFEIELDGFTTVNSKGGIRCFAVNVNPNTDDPFTLPIIFGLDSKVLLVTQRTPKGFGGQCKLNIPSSAVCIAFSRTTACFATTDNYFVLDTASKTIIPLFPFSGIPPCIAVAHSDEFLVRANEELAVFVQADGTSARPPAILANSSRVILFKDPNVVYLSNDTINLANVSRTDGFTEQIEVAGVSNICCLDGTIFVSDGSDVFSLSEQSLEEKVAILVKNKQYSLAIDAYQERLSKSYSEELFIGLSALKEEIGYIKLAERDFSEALTLFMESDVDIIQVIDNVRDKDLTADPEASIFLINFLSEVRSFPRALPVKEKIDTALIELCFEQQCMDDLSELSNFSPEAEIAADLYQRNGDLLKAADYYCIQKKYTEVVACWKKAEEMGTEINKVELVEFMNNCEDIPAVVGLASLVISNYPDEVAEKFYKASVPIEQARPVIYGLPQWKTFLERCEQSDDVLYELALLLISNIKSDPSGRSQLRRLLVKMKDVAANRILPQLNDSSLEVEKLLATSAKNPKVALNAILNDCKDFESAVILCCEYADTNPELGLELLQSNLNFDISDTTVATGIASLLSSFASSVDAVTVMSKLPECLRVQQLSSFLTTAMSLKIEEDHINTLKLALLEKAAKQAEKSKKNTFVKLTETSSCPVCKKIFTYEEPLLFLPTGYIIHSQCHRHLHLCPVTNTMF